MPRITPPSAPISTRAKLAWLMLAWMGQLLMTGLPRAESPPLMLAEIYREDVNPADYWVSEKLDGVRAYWDGSRLLFRSGQTIQAPDWFTRELPRTALDGELWIGRGQFEKLSPLFAGSNRWMPNGARCVTSCLNCRGPTVRSPSGWKNSSRSSSRPHGHHG